MCGGAQLCQPFLCQAFADHTCYLTQQSQVLHTHTQRSSNLNSSVGGMHAQLCQLPQQWPALFLTICCHERLLLEAVCDAPCTEQSCAAHLIPKVFCHVQFITHVLLRVLQFLCITCGKRPTPHAVIRSAACAVKHRVCCRGCCVCLLLQGPKRAKCKTMKG
jgi:hypothetical protein